MKYQKKLLLSGLIAVVLVCFGVLANWYLVMESIDQVNGSSDTVAGLHINPYQELYDELLRPSVMVSTPSGTGSGVVIASGRVMDVACEFTRNSESKLSRYRMNEVETYVLTAAHVVGDEDTVKVTFYYYGSNSVDTTITASVIITDTLKDLALLRAYTYKPYPYVARLASKDYVPYIFTPIWVIGCSLGYPPRPTSGEVTTINNHWGINAPIWPGNSGGGVFLKDTNELIGIAVLVKVYRWQLATTMGSIVTLADIYEFLGRNSEIEIRG